MGHARRDEVASRVTLALGYNVLAPFDGRLAHYAGLRRDLLLTPILKARERLAKGLLCHVVLLREGVERCQVREPIQHQNLHGRLRHTARVARAALRPAADLAEALSIVHDIHHHLKANGAPRHHIIVHQVLWHAYRDGPAVDDEEVVRGVAYVTDSEAGGEPLVPKEPPNEPQLGCGEVVAALERPGGPKQQVDLVARAVRGTERLS
mmetsp:Transcript_92138/g.263315  ORF Transcript_92138/g.263315 Transcript_92138/m.263315 type:complete len:208 (-) Transcript_92138:213-836(-)